MKYGLTETAIEKISSVFARFPEIEKAVLYGSRAKGNFKTGSAWAYCFTSVSIRALL